MNTNILAVYDNEDRSYDRYTIYISRTECLCMSDDPGHPQGVSQFSIGEIGDHNGKRINFNDLPKNIQQHTIQRLG